jgi:3-methyl-2-oxobutanoate hydroxymethyltransferase
MTDNKPIRVPDIIAMKARGENVTVLTAYDATMAGIFDQAGIDILLVGDSLGMVLYGDETTLEVTMEDMIRHTRAVRRGSKRALVVADMPFMSYQASVPEAVRNAGRFLQKGGAAAVKVEGGATMTLLVERLVSIGIPVMGHLGLLPQSVHQMGGFRRQGSEKNARNKLIAEAIALEEAGAFSIVLECIPEDLAEEITRQVRVPTIGIGSGPHCDGQVLVSYDMLGLTEKAPPFVKKYAQLGKAMTEAAQAFAKDVRARAKK